MPMSSINKLTANLSLDQKKALFLKQLSRQQTITIGDYNLGKIKSWIDFSSSAGFKAPEEIANAEVFGITAIVKCFKHKKARVEAGEDLLENKEAPQVVVQPVSDTGPVIVEPGIVTDVIINNGKIDRPLPEADEFSALKAYRENPLIRYDGSTRFQERATATLLRNLIKHNHRAAALSAGVGTGKTFILGAFLRESWDRGWYVLTQSLSPYPVLFVTRASVVTQTERVLNERFGLKPGREVIVTNIDQLRATLGEQIIQERQVVTNGQAHTVYTWNPLLAPALMILDEAHSVKNIDSNQSRRVQAFNDIPGLNNRCIYSSATLFTRVVETKCFAVATRLEW